LTQTNSKSYTNIPAGFRYEFNAEVPASGADTTPPTLSTVTISTDGTTWTLAFNEAVTFGAGGNSGFTTSMSGGSVTLTYSSGSGSSSLVYTGSRTVFSGETGTLNYTQPSNGVEDTAGNDLANVSNKTVTNNSSQTPIIPVGIKILKLKNIKIRR
jgi:hypothetical protein